MLTIPPDGKLEGNMPFILIIGWAGECTILFAVFEPEKTFPWYFSFAFLTLIGLEAHSCDPAGSIFHNRAKNMPAMFSLAQSVCVFDMKATGLLFLLLPAPLFLETLALWSRPCYCSDNLERDPQWNNCRNGFRVKYRFFSFFMVVSLMTHLQEIAGLEMFFL